MPGFFSFVYQRLMDERGATMEDLCYPAIKNHYNAQFNPLAQYNKPLTYEQIMASRVSRRSHNRPASAVPRATAGRPLFLLGRIFR